MAFDHDIFKCFHFIFQRKRTNLQALLYR